MRIATGTLTLSLFLLSGAAHAASYFVQPIVFVSPGSFINGLEIDGNVESSHGYNNAPLSINSIVSLSDGTLKGNVVVDGTAPSGGFSQGRFGERVTFVNGEGTTANFTFSFDGFVTADARDPNLNSHLQIEVDAYVAIFAPEAGANASTWYDLSFGAQDQTLFKDRLTLSFDDPAFDLDEYISHVFSAALPVDAGRTSFDIFANLSLIVSKNLNPGYVGLDFLNTATFGIEVEEGVTYTSLSGSFLEATGVTAVPLPATAWLTLTGLGGLAAMRARRRPGRRIPQAA